MYAGTDFARDGAPFWQIPKIWDDMEINLESSKNDENTGTILVLLVLTCKTRYDTEPRKDLRKASKKNRHRAGSAASPTKNERLDVRGTLRRWLRRASRHGPIASLAPGVAAAASILRTGGIAKIIFFFRHVFANLLSIFRES